MIRLERITINNFEEVCELRVYDHQKEFVAPNVYSLAEAFACRNDQYFAMPLAIYSDQELIGFVMIGYGTLGDEPEPSYAKDGYCLWRLMIDEKHQKKGFFKPAMDKILEYVRTFPCGKSDILWLSYEPENKYAEALYFKYGFEPTKEFAGEEVVAIYHL